MSQDTQNYDALFSPQVDMGEATKRPSMTIKSEPIKAKEAFTNQLFDSCHGTKIQTNQFKKNGYHG